MEDNVLSYIVVGLLFGPLLLGMIGCILALFFGICFQICTGVWPESPSIVVCEFFHRKYWRSRGILNRTISWDNQHKKTHIENWACSKCSRKVEKELAGHVYSKLEPPSALR
mgnify:CR=1 FL=1